MTRHCLHSYTLSASLTPSHLSVHTHIHVRTYTPTHTYTYMHTCTHAHTHTHMHTHTHTHTHICTHTRERSLMGMQQHRSHETERRSTQTRGTGVIVSPELQQQRMATRGQRAYGKSRFSMQSQGLRRVLCYGRREQTARTRWKYICSRSINRLQ